MAAIARDLERQYPDDNARHGLGVEASAGLPVVTRASVGRFVAMLFGLVGIILAIACFNVAGMLLVRGVTRAPEISLRLALGAARHRIVRLLAIESLIVSLIGAALGLFGAFELMRLAAGALPLLRYDVTFDPAIDWRVVLFSVALAAIVGLACGVIPARAATRVDLASTFVRDGGNTPGRRLRTRSTFVMAQVALSTILVVCALLLARSLRYAGDMAPGFSVDGIEVVGVNLRLGGYDAARGRLFAANLMARLEALPELTSVASAFVVPLSGEREGGRVWLPEEQGDDRVIDASQNLVTPTYFQTLGLQLIAGRNFAASDRAGAPTVIIVNETLAKRAWPGQDPVGKHLALGASRRPLEVVGVVRDAKYRSIGERATPFFYMPSAQRYESPMWILMRPASASAIPLVQEVIRTMDPNLPIVQSGTLGDLTAFSLFPHRVLMWLASIVGLVGVLLAALGVYGVTAYHASRRTREIGIRVALGARRGQILALIFRNAVSLAAIGTGLGLAGAALVTRLLRDMLYGVNATDPVSFAGAVVILVAVALAAGIVPALRAASGSAVAALKAHSCR
jgi:predicted permease